MTEPPPDADRPPLLIQQRMALDRRRKWAMYTLISSAVIAVGWILIVASEGPEVMPWLMALVFIASVIFAVIELVKVRRDVRAFTAEYGADAGVQKPVR